MPALKGLPQLRTDHPVLVYKTSEIVANSPQTVLLSTPIISTLEPQLQYAFAFSLSCFALSLLLLWISHLQLKALVLPHCH